MSKHLKKNRYDNKNSLSGEAGDFLSDESLPVIHKLILSKLFLENRELNEKVYPKLLKEISVVQSEAKLKGFIGWEKHRNI
ncbi:MAG: hypothetical protein NZT61_04375 [Deltaproteobacteria bacterium]|nr:hypothetical protein [Deltaproteobacteria bacterium]MCX7952595.1 hypothetical protein [Deltaproteobacteria bacterium]